MVRNGTRHLILRRVAGGPDVFLILKATIIVWVDPLTARDSESPVDALENGLAAAAGKLRAHDVWTATRKGLDRATSVVGGTAAAAAASVVAVRLVAAPAALTFWMGGIGLLASAIVIGSSFVSAWRGRPSPSSVAERLDLATPAHNAIATALDLARSGDVCPFAVRAITAGVDHLKVAGNVNPLIPTRPQQGQSWALPAIAVGSVLLAAALWLPARTTPRIVFRHVGAAELATDTLMSTPADLRRPASPAASRVPSTPARTGTPTASPTPPSHNRNEQTRTGAPASSAATGTSSGNSSTMAKTTSGAAPPNSSAVGRASDPGGTPLDPKSTAKLPKSPTPLSSFGSAAADASPSPGFPNGGSGGDSDDADTSAGKSRPAGGAAAATASKESLKAKASGSGGGNSDEGGPSKIASATQGHGLSSSDAVGGRGQGSGENAPKKTRGVAPLLLATPEPDFFQGKSLTGPEQRTGLQLAPRPAPGELSPAAPATDRADDEPPVPVCGVSNDAKRAVDAYFERFHQDPSDHGPSPDLAQRVPQSEGR